MAGCLLRCIAIVLFALGLVALPFAAIYTMGAVGTGGREAVGELSVMIAVASVGLLGGLGAWRAANGLGSPGRKNDPPE